MNHLLALFHLVKCIFEWNHLFSCEDMYQIGILLSGGE
jgi:hypothetical protein